MNSPFVLTASKRFAERLQREAGSKVDDQVALAWRLAFATEPTAEEVAQAAAFVSEQTTHFAAHPVPAKKDQPAADPSAEALAVFCQALLSSNHFLYVD